MERRFERELESLKTSIIKMGSVVEDNFSKALESVLRDDLSLAKAVIDGDGRINELEMEIDNAVIDLLALQQPVATDLRLIIAVQKINNDLERIGDHAVNIAESAEWLGASKDKEPLLQIPRMAELTRTVLRHALDSFILLDPKLAQTVLERDDQIDLLNKETVREVIGLIKSDSRTVDGGMQIIRISRNLERVGDLSTNIAEEVIFLTQARVVKHHAAEVHHHPMQSKKH
ncbi:MAG: phosphate signaling complex protein PhoU [Bacteroidetes bacterium]|jgi:phosphate transport system protein|nr:phosphate signaling complex protein PhoU [Bacteroidota bacterium]